MALVAAAAVAVTGCGAAHRARHLQLAAPVRVLVPEATRDQLLELELPGSAAPSRTVSTGSLPHDAAAVRGRVFVTDEFGHAVSVIAGDTTVRRIGGFVQPGGVARAGGDAAVVDVGADTVTLIDGRTLMPTNRITAGPVSPTTPRDATGASTSSTPAGTRCSRSEPAHGCRSAHD